MPAPNPSDPPPPLVAAGRADAARLARRLAVAGRREHGDVVLLELQGPADDVPALAEDLGPRRTLRLLDHLWLVLPAADAPAERLLAEVYDALAPGYAARVDAERTRDNITILLALVAECLLDGPPLVVDLGCGIGLAAEPARAAGLELLGVDVSPAMRAEARRRGEPSVAPEELARLAPGSARGVIASYLLHLVPRPAGLEEAWRAIAPGGVLAGNVHKGRRLEEAAAALHGLGARVERRAPRPEAAHHGPLLLAVKPR